MTISVTVTNSDSREGAVIAVTTVPHGATVAESANPSRPRVELKGGGKGSAHEFMVHSGQSLIISEVQNG